MPSELEKRGFSVKDVIYIVIIVLGGAANWYTMNDRVGDGETERAAMTERVTKLEEANKVYASLPRDVQKMQADIEKNAKTTTAIYYGLLAKGIVEPPK